MPDESTEVIEQKMSDTRDALTLKVSALENQVVDTIQSASATVSNMVEQVKTAVPETIAGVKDSISEAKASVAEGLRDTLNVSKHTRERPWAMVGGAAALGFIAGMILFRRSYAAPAVPSSFASTPTASSIPVAAAAAAPMIRLPGWLDQIVDKLGDRVTQEVRKLGEVAVATASASLQQSVERVLPNLLGGLGTEADGENTNRVATHSERNGFSATRTP